jgi:hypothetical protein
MVFLAASAQSTLLLFFSVTLASRRLAFCSPPFFHSDVFSKPLFQSPHKGKKDVCTPTTTTVLHLCQKKNNPKLLYITYSYIRALA